MSRPTKQADPLEPERHQCARVEVSSNHSRDRGSTMNVTTYGLDLAKRVFPMHLKNPLCQIQAVSRNVHGGSPVPRVVARHFHSGTLMPFGLQGVRLLRRPTHHTLPLRSEEGGVHLI